MADILSLFAIGLPATSIGAFALYLALNRTQITFFGPRQGDLLILSLLVMLGGHLLLLLAATMGGSGYAAWGWLLIGLGLAVACATGIGLVRYSESQHRLDATSASQGALSRAQVEAVSRAAEASGIGLLIVDRGKNAADRVTLCNLPAAALLGMTPETSVGQPLAILLRIEEREAVSRLAERAAKNPGQSMSASLQLAPRGVEGERIPVEVGLTFLGTEGAGAFAVTLVDARAKRTAIAAAREARSDADFYLDLVTHDLSNFNQGALGYLELIELNKDASLERIRAFEAKALRQIRASSRLIENVKLLSVIRESKDEMEPVDAMHALHDAIDHTVFGWTEKDVEVRLVPMTEAYMVRADPWLRDLFTHILDNSVKFSAEKRVEVAVSVAEGEGGRTLVFRIADRGRGITPAERDIILDRLASRKRDFSAYRSGIGLFIVKTITDRYGGRLWIEERVPGEHAKGSVFCVELPRA